ncbi:hypothetical protein B0H66DRAFT_80951 [Apodospora peruviana]|uniref:Uncharacterized protein n=1 Tax=Apodospora peruviana TaxID=516989 RepID=A0AAE0ITL4_9PEZI|nr:hypothetical protein B0H66DRAFT_80951 [Apodospora peruviana]
MGGRASEQLPLPFLSFYIPGFGLPRCIRMDKDKDTTDYLSAFFFFRQKLLHKRQKMGVNKEEAGFFLSIYLTRLAQRKGGTEFDGATTQWLTGFFFLILFCHFLLFQVISCHILYYFGGGGRGREDIPIDITTRAITTLIVNERCCGDIYVCLTVNDLCG